MAIISTGKEIRHRRHHRHHLDGQQDGLPLQRVPSSPSSSSSSSSSSYFSSFSLIFSTAIIIYIFSVQQTLVLAAKDVASSDNKIDNVNDFNNNKNSNNINNNNNNVLNNNNNINNNNYNNNNIVGDLPQAIQQQQLQQQQHLQQQQQQIQQQQQQMQQQLQQQLDNNRPQVQQINDKNVIRDSNNNNVNNNNNNNNVNINNNNDNINNLQQQQQQLQNEPFVPKDRLRYYPSGTATANQNNINNNNINNNDNNNNNVQKQTPSNNNNINNGYPKDTNNNNINVKNNINNDNSNNDINNNNINNVVNVVNSINDINNNNINNNVNVVNSNNNNFKYGNSNMKFNISYPVPEPRVNPIVREDAEFNFGVNYYALKASADSRFLIRYTPKLSFGTPWPMPQVYNPTKIALRVSRDVVFSVNFVPKLEDVVDVPNTNNDFNDANNAGFSSSNNNNYKRDSKQQQQSEVDSNLDPECSVLNHAIDRIKKITFGGGWDKNAGLVDRDGNVVSGGDGNGDSQHDEDVVVDGGDGSKSGVLLKKMVIKMQKPCEMMPHLHMDESYVLKVSKTGLTLSAMEVWGILRGLETFSQLVYQKEGDYMQYWINKTYVKDYPRFKHRGVLLDTSRHYLSLHTILENLESMANNKLNVFHWHIVDDQSFPFQSKTYPNLTKMGAYDPVTHIYTHEDIATVIEEARLRGIRVIPEFDTPGHTFSWGFGQNHLLTPCYDYKGIFNGLYGPINPILKKNYGFLKNLFKEVLSLFKDKYIHLGGDEVPFDCWLSNIQIQNFMKKNFLNDIKQILSFFERQLLQLISANAKSLNRKTGSIVWQEMFDNDVELPKDTIIQVWSGDSYDVERVIKAGYAVIFSTCWYLDYIQYGQDWDKYYLCEQIAHLRLKNESNFYGGEICLWAEYTDDSDILTRMWPRASAAAERLWSDRNVNNIYRAATRIETQRCRMMERGLQVGVLSGPNHCPKFRKKHQMMRSKNNKNKNNNNGETNVATSNDDNNEGSKAANGGDFPSDAKNNANVIGGNKKKSVTPSLSFAGKLQQQQRMLRRNNFILENLDKTTNADWLSGGVSGRLMGLTSLSCIIIVVIIICLLTRRKLTKFHSPTYFLSRNYRILILFMIFILAAFIWFQPRQQQQQKLYHQHHSQND